VGLITPGWAARISDVKNTKHNFSTNSPTLLFDENGNPVIRSVEAVSETQICVFCHTPHAANPQAKVPLWNRGLSGATYQVYGSQINGSGTSSLDATVSQPNGISKLCLSCHDGTLAIGAVDVLNGTASSTVEMAGVGGSGEMAPGTFGVDSGFTRNLGTDLTNDHPISLMYDHNLVVMDGEMRVPSEQADIVVRTRDPLPADQPRKAIHLQPVATNTTGGLVQCNSCHDPHIRDDEDPGIKFLRLNRLQKNVHPSTDTVFNKDNDIICLSCHQKEGWAGSAHANSDVADEVYTSNAAALREFPTTGLGTQVWQSSCLACHDTHTVQGSRRLLREGTDSLSRPKQGGAPALEQTCYACHSNDGDTLVTQGLNTEVPDVKSDFSLPRHMPITSEEQGNFRTEVHDIGSSVLPQAGKDFLESAAKLGKISAGGTLNNRHAECTDCHNPHRVTKTRLFYTDPFTGSAEDDRAAGTHNHSAPHSNIASGVLKGTWGVEPTYISNSFHIDPIFDVNSVKRGNPPINASTLVTSEYVTREYQVCLKCHSNYSYDTPPSLGVSTPPNTNGMMAYTNQATEFHAPLSHADEPVSLGLDGGAGVAPVSANAPDWNTNNHRSWHPTMRATGRTAAKRNANANNWLAPFNSAIGSLTMYCSDCHGSNTNVDTVVPGDGSENSRPWGPHGSENDFILKGAWSGDRLNGTGELQGSPGAQNHLCFKCHDFDQYANPAAAPQDSGFSMTGMCSDMCGGGGMGGMGGMNNLHIFHANQVQNFRCNFCHVAVPHGWKNKNFLVNLNDVGPESTNGDRGEVRNNTTAAYTNGPYYNRAVLKVVTFAQSGGWDPGRCGSANTGGNGQTGVNWMAFGSEACNNVP